MKKILSIQDIGKKYEQFLLHDDRSYDHSVIIRDITEDAYFILRGSYHLQITAVSICDRYVVSAYNADYENKYVKGWEVVDTFDTREELETYIDLLNESIDKVYYAHGMTAYLSEVYYTFNMSRDGEEYYTEKLFYVDEETGFVYGELSFAHIQGTEYICHETARETYVEKDYYGPGEDEEIYYPMQNGIKGIMEDLKHSYGKTSSLYDMYESVGYKVTKLGVV